MAAIFKSGGQIEWRIQDFQKKGRVTCECKLFQPFWVPLLRLIYSTYFILKNLAAKGISH
jgi:hypothetical protein